MEALQYLEEQKLNAALIRDVERFREKYQVADEVKHRVIVPGMPFYGKEILEMGIAALLQKENLLLTGSKATGKNVLAENLAWIFGRPSYNISFHVNMGSAELIGTDTFEDNQVKLRKGSIYQCAQYGGFGILDEINMAKNDAVSVLHATLDYRRSIDVPGYDKIELHEASRFIGTMNYGYAGTKELNEALVSRFLVIAMPEQTEETLEKILAVSFPDAKKEALEQFMGLFLDLQTKAENGEISTKPLDLRGILAAIRTIRQGLTPAAAVRMGIVNKCFDAFEREIVEDVVLTRIPEEWTASDVFLESGKGDRMEENQIEIANRIKNLIWTVCGDYTMDAKPDVEGFLRSKYVALYDGIKQGAFAKYFDREALSLYLVKKVYLGGVENALLEIARLCMEEAVGKRISKERRGVDSIRKKAYEYVLEHDMERLVRYDLGRLKIAFMRQSLTGDRCMESMLAGRIESLEELQEAQDTLQVIRKIDACYNAWADPDFEKRVGTLEKVLAVTPEELMEYSWKDFLTEEMYEENFEAYLEQVSQQMTGTMEKKEEPERQQRDQKRILRVSEADLKKVYTYIELNFGKTYLNPLEEKKINFQMCKGIHGDCGLYFTDGILANPVKRNYQLEYAKKQRDKNKYAYYDNHRMVKRNIAILTGVLKKSIALRREQTEIIADRGQLRPEKLWRIGRSSDARMFSRVLEQDNREFVVDVLIDASGSQRVRQEKVALQAYIIMQALSNAGIPHRVMSFCTFWDHTILQRYREYDEDASANERIFSFTTSSNNRDGLAIKAASQGLLAREEEHKIMIVLSDGRPYDVILNRPNARNPQPYYGEYALRDTGTEVRRLRNMGVSVLGVFVGEEKDLDAEKKIFGKDFAYIHDISKFSMIVGSYLTKHLEENC